MPKKSHLAKGDTYEPQPVVATLGLTPASPDMAVRSGTLFETVKLAIHPVADKGTLCVPAACDGCISCVFRRDTAKSDKGASVKSVAGVF